MEHESELKIAPSSDLNNDEKARGDAPTKRSSIYEEIASTKSVSRSSLKDLNEAASQWSILKQNRDYIILLELLVSGPRDGIGVFFQQIHRLPMINKVDEVGLSPMHLTAMLGRLDVLVALIRWGGQVNLVGKGNKIPLHIACAEGHLEVVELLLEHKANVLHADDSGYTALHYAAEGGFDQICYLLIVAGADVKAKDNCGGQTPLHLACLLGHPLCVETLLDGGADMDQNNDWGHPPHHVLQNIGREKVLQISFIMDRFRGGSRMSSYV